nr:hypothetical protein [Tanacetum cinerariifolium]
MPLDIRADESVHQEGVTVWKRAITIDASLVAAQESDNIAKTQSKATSIDPISQETTLGVQLLKLEEAKTTQDKVITILKLRVRRLEKKRKARTSQLMKRRLFKGRVKTSTDKSFEDKDSSEKGSSSADQVSTARPEVSAATPSAPPPITTIFGDEDLTIAQTLITMWSEKAKEKGVAFRDVEEPPRLTRSTTTLQPLPTIDLKDKEEELAKLDIAQKERQTQKEATIAALIEEFDKIQARMDADNELEEKEIYTIEKRARLLEEYFKRRKKQLATEKAEAIRNKPPTRTQVNNKMITYLKHIDYFVPMDSKKEEKKSVEPESKDKKGIRIKGVAYSIRSRSITAIWLEKVVTRLIEPAIKNSEESPRQGFAAAPAILKPERLKVDKTRYE